MALTTIEVEKAKPKDREFKLSDSKGLVLLVKPSGGKYWRFRYRYEGKEKMLSVGVYPEVTLKHARERRDMLRQQLADGTDPGFAREISNTIDSDGSFEAIAREWHKSNSKKWSVDHALRVLTRLEKDVFPYVGDKPIGEIKAPQLLMAFRRVEQRGAIETAHRARADCGAIFRYGVATGRCERDPCADLRGALKPIVGTHFAAITEPSDVGNLLRVIEGYQGGLIVRHALRIAPYVFARPGELRHMEWSELTLEGAAPEWRIPPEKMKSRELHIVPMSKQAIAVLREIHPLTGHGRYVFPAIRGNDRPLSDNTLNAALRRMGFTKDEMTSHGFRSLASSLLNEQGYPPDAIERQLAHAPRDKTRAAYNRAAYLGERRKMMQAWADYLDGLRAGGQILPLFGNAKR